MKSWPAPQIPVLPGQGPDPVVHDSATRGPVTIAPDGTARLYVCGITPYDATHLGHAATYVTFDILGRVLRDTGRAVHYVQNVTDIDDPLLERAARDGVDWTELATSEIQLFRDDMTALRVVPPDDYIGVVEAMASIETRVAFLCAAGLAYRVPVPADELDGRPAAADVYLDLTGQDTFGQVSGWSRDEMAEVFAERGGDPQRPGKRDPFDPLLWRAARAGEPSWPSATLGAGRPGWHVECTAIALDHLGTGFDVQGGGVDLVFPHHEMSAVQGEALTHEPFAGAYVHQAMVGLDGAKMSKSKGNLVLVSRLLADGIDPMAIRLLLLAQHYRTPWDYTPARLAAAQERLAGWRAAVATSGGTPAGAVLAAVRRALADDLDTPEALRIIDAWAASSPAAPDTAPETAPDTAPDTAPVGVAQIADALLGVAL